MVQLEQKLQQTSDEVPSPIEPESFLKNVMSFVRRRPVTTVLAFGLAVTPYLTWSIGYEAVTHDLNAGASRAEIEEHWEKLKDETPAGEAWDWLFKYGRAQAFVDYEQQH
ncbi:hypothetical protein GOV10_03715 [Candidatus Woesearchaeota archaeon]|nr:hypothetical protein [Candidatus Woesearchaeota archaeon]